MRLEPRTCQRVAAYLTFLAIYFLPWSRVASVGIWLIAASGSELQYCRGYPCAEEIARFLSKEAVATSIQEERETPCREERNDSRSIVDAWDLWSIGCLDVSSDFHIRINLGYCQFMLHYFVYQSHTSYVSSFKDLVLYVGVEYLMMFSLLHNSIGRLFFVNCH